MSAFVPESLRQSDIDALVGLAPEVTGRPALAPYDFTEPPRLGVTLEKSLRATLETVAARWHDLMTSRLRTPIDVTLGRIERASGRDVALALGEPSAVWTFPTGARADGRAWLAFDAAFALVVVDRLLGGPGPAPEAPRALTPLEQRLVGALAHDAVEPVRAALSPAAPVAPGALEFASDPALVPGLASGTQRYAVEFAFSGLDVPGVATLVLPVEVVESRGDAALEAPRPSPTRAHTAATLRRARVELAVRWPALRLAARTLVGLAPGSLLPLPAGPEDAVELLVNGRPRYLAAIGESNGRLALRIVRSLVPPRAARAGHQEDA